MLEAMIAVAVTVTALSAAIRAQLTARQAIDEARETQIASAVLRSQMDLLEQAGLIDVWSGDAGYVDGALAPGVDFGPLSVASLTFATPDLIAGLLPPSVLVVRLQLDWQALSGVDRTLVMHGALR